MFLRSLVIAMVTFPIHLEVGEEKRREKERDLPGAGRALLYYLASALVTTRFPTWM